jgi:hypothetical protein
LADPFFGETPVLGDSDGDGDELGMIGVVKEEESTYV